MPKLIAWFVDNPVAANLLMSILIASGLLALNDLRKEEFPNVDAPVVMVTVPYLGAAPAEVETGVCARICLLYTSPSPRDKCRSRMPSSA